MPEFRLPIFVVACLGGVLPDILRIARNRYDTSLPDYLKSRNFWLLSIILILLGGFTAWILDTSSVKDALIIGYTSPQIISQLVGSARAKREMVPLGGSQGSSKLTNWWSK